MASERFTFQASKDDLVQIFDDGKRAKMLKGRAAIKFLNRVTQLPPEAQQMLMAKATGQYKFGNERQGELSRPDGG